MELAPATAVEAAEIVLPCSAEALQPTVSFLSTPPLDFQL
eukprot:SAG11_NODE_24296_length_375_cov_1.119565_1_plen_39_part_01